MFDYVAEGIEHLADFIKRLLSHFLVAGNDCGDVVFKSPGTAREARSWTLDVLKEIKTLANILCIRDTLLSELCGLVM